MRYVIDASVGFKWEVIEPLSDKAQRLRDDFRNGVCDLLAERRGTILPGQGTLFLADLLTTLPRLHASIPDLVPRAYAIAELMYATVYDCLYVALAEREGCQLITADDKLVRKLQPRFPFVVPLSSLP
jgi:predicted nucleic acid-binding protein